MNNRIASLLGALAALIIVIMLLTPQKNTTQKPPSLPTSEDNGAYGIHALKRWLDESNIPNQSFRDRFDILLTSTSISSTGNLLIMHSPSLVPPRRNELQQLQYWIEQGNTLLLLTGAADTPPWLFQTNMNYKRILEQFGLSLEIEKPDVVSDSGEQNSDESIHKSRNSFSDLLLGIADSMDQSEYQQEILSARIEHPITRNAKHITTSHLPFMHKQFYLQSNAHSRASLVLYSNEQSAPALWLTSVENGWILTSSYSNLFGNNFIQNKGNASLLLSIINQSLSGNGVVLIDDMHFGLSNLYDPDTFFSDSRVHNTLWFIFLFWLIYVIGHNNRIAPPAPKKNYIAAVDFVIAVGGFFARKVDSSSAALSLFEHFFNEVRCQFKLPMNSSPVWDILETSPRISAKELNSLQSWYENIPHKRKHNLVKLRNSLIDCKEKLA